MEFRLLRPEEVIEHWPTLALLLEPAVAQCNDELAVDDVRGMVLGGRVFLFALMAPTPIFAITIEFKMYPKKTTMFVGFAGGHVGKENIDPIWNVLQEFGRKAGATTVQAFAQNPAMVRYHRRFTGAEPTYFVLEKPL